MIPVTWYILHKLSLQSLILVPTFMWWTHLFNQYQVNSHMLSKRYCLYYKLLITSLNPVHPAMTLLYNKFLDLSWQWNLQILGWSTTNRFIVFDWMILNLICQWRSGWIRHHTCEQDVWNSIKYWLQLQDFLLCGTFTWTDFSKNSNVSDSQNKSYFIKMP